MRDSPPGRVFVTGGGGFVGSRLLPRLADARPVAALARSATPLPPGVEAVAGDLLRPESYASALADCEVVVHLAAVTGRARNERYHRVNVEGTRRLLDACRERGVEEILFVSTIAARWPRDLPYPYAESKAAAEELVRASGLRYRIVRPTMVFGPGSPVLEGLTRMARLPLTPLLDGGGARVQPIHVDDLCELLCQVVDEGAFEGATLELGGPEILALGELLERIGRARGRTVRALRLPGAPVLRLLAALERFTGPRLPVTAGQLSAFLHDGVAGGDRLDRRHRHRLRGIAEMIGGEASVSGAEALLERECALFTRYLTGVRPTPYVVDRYRAAHATLPELRRPATAIERTLLALGRLPATVRIADAYARLFDRAGPLRRKLVLLLAILEMSPPLAGRIERVDPVSRPRLFLRLAGRAAGSVACALAGTALLLPLHLLFGLTGGVVRAWQR